MGGAKVDADSHRAILGPRRGLGTSFLPGAPRPDRAPALTATGRFFR
ncbi:hypothetical protein HMPREF0591_6009 [Mycobacterium parascrofulaceum ATCC BAA-614]|uniref:Uncharacterized protein n=1 Tax=Mycobacterium parascrofulaceum ATCC BAA-614 TaxID=525368 RepID=D5PIL5_9MYCO|nr:hypothetical protein HMPREF0591_6009 [Mycobacterium parascrofulaceum ATCC BAA-614]